MRIDVYFSRRGRGAIIENALGTDAASLRVRPGGKPYLPGGLEFSLSDCRDIHVCAVSRQPVGVDIEQIKPRNLDAIIRSFHADERCRLSALSGDERLREFYRIWTVKEARAKLDGQGISRQGLREINSENPDFFCKSALYNREYVISVCAHDPAEVIFREQVEDI